MRLSLLTLPFLFVLFATPCTAKDNTIRMAFSERGWPPYEIIDDQGTSGIMADIMVEISRTLGLTVEITAVADKRRADLIIKGDLDACPMAREWIPRAYALAWTEPVTTSDDLLIFRKNTEFPFEKPEDLLGKSIGCVRAFHYPTLQQYFQKGQIKRHDAANTQVMLKVLKMGRVDAAIINGHVARWLIKNDPSLSEEDFTLSSVPVASAPYGYMFTKNEKWNAFILQFNQELARMKKDGRLKAIMDKYR